jgi:hypothetical protein
MVYDTGRTNPIPTNTARPAGEFGCIGERTCNSCGAVVGDSICMCMGIFTCPRCGEENNQSFLGSYTVISDEALDNIYIGLGISNPPPTPPNNSAIAEDFPEEIGDIIAKLTKLTKEEVTKLIDYIRTKS